MIQSCVNTDFIATRRKELGLTQEEMAKNLGMNSAPAYNKYEKGIYKFNADVVPSLLRVLKCEIDDIFLPVTLTK
ncbi:MAG: helix-turn-helix transcriptional regulator [Selenomonadaceae bacterium]|nr:helix-turn-helix transcriptional regulator [Selenomonadaceae bacterium]